MLQVIGHFFQKRSRQQRINAIRVAFELDEPLSQFIARDVRREILVINIDEIESGFIVAQARTNNLLYLSKNLTDKSEFGDPERMPIEDMWKWTGQSWGGLPDGTSIVDHIQSDGDRLQNGG